MPWIYREHINKAYPKEGVGDAEAIKEIEAMAEGGYAPAKLQTAINYALKYNKKNDSTQVEKDKDGPKVKKWVDKYMQSEGLQQLESVTSLICGGKGHLPSGITRPEVAAKVTVAYKAASPKPSN